MIWVDFNEKGCILSVNIIYISLFIVIVNNIRMDILFESMESVFVNW